MMLDSINLWEKYWNNRWKKSRWKIFSTVSMFYKNFSLRKSKKKSDENLEFKDEQDEDVRKDRDFKIRWKFYVIEISKTIVSLTEKHVKVLLNSEIEICIMTLEILNRCDFAMKIDSKFDVINVTKNNFFLEKMCENAKVCLEKIIVRIFIFIIKIENHDLIFEILYERKIMFSSKYFIDDFCEIIISSKCDTKRVKF